MSAQCGTTRGYHRHQREKTVTCRPCLDSLSEYQRARNIRIGKTGYLTVTVELLAELLHGPCAEAVRRELGDKVSSAILTRFPKDGPS